MVITKLALSHILLQYNSIPILNPTERMLLKCVKKNQINKTNITKSKKLQTLEKIFFCGKMPCLPTKHFC